MNQYQEMIRSRQIREVQPVPVQDASGSSVSARGNKRQAEEGSRDGYSRAWKVQKTTNNV